jgi:hypothetical protein
MTVTGLDGGCVMRVTSCELRDTGYELRVTRYELRVTGPSIWDLGFQIPD